MLASLPMYDLPELQWATNDFWGALAKRLGTNLPLTRAEDWTSTWHAPNLLFSQTCGYPFTHAFAGQLTYVATPHYGADGCDGPNYSSILFAREKVPLDAFRGTTAAINNADSMSGMLALQLVFSPLARNQEFFARAIETGGHIKSMEAVQSGQADVCAIDCVTVGLCRAHRPTALEGLVEVGRSPSVPGLPYITRAGDVAKLRDALAGAFADPSLKDARDTLLLTGYSILPAGAYDIITELEAVL
jgi:ABC-type phosphate/phosphonate transport system substrate-binding protein